MTASSASTSVDVLILGAGWTAEFLIPLLTDQNVTFAATSRTGGERHGSDTIKFVFDPESEDASSFGVLPDAQTVLIVFPIYKSGSSERLVRHWEATHVGSTPLFIQLGSTGIWNGDRTFSPDATGKKNDSLWSDRHSPFDTTNQRANAESELLELGPNVRSTILNLSGLWGGPRSVKNFVGRIAPTKEALADKGDLHMINGLDVARAILAVHRAPQLATGQRWLVTNGRVYDWWDLVSGWGTGADAQGVPTGPQPGWVRELMLEKGVRALPRAPTEMGRALDSREFWSTFGLSPAVTTLS